MEFSLETLVEQAKGIEEKLANLEAFKKTLSKEQEEKFSTLAEDVKNLSEAQHRLARQMLDMEQKGAAKLAGGQKRTTLGQRFVECDAFKAFMEGKLTKATLAAASPVATPDGAVPAYYQGIKGEPELPNVVNYAFAHVPTTSNSITYLKESAFTNSAAETAEGGDTHESKMEFTEADAPVRTIAHFIRVTKQLADDAPALAAYINTRMMYGLNRRIEKQLLNGDGSSSNLKGIFATGNYTVHGFTEDNMPTGSTVLDLIRRCAATMRKNGYTANSVFLNPMDFDTLRGMKDTNGAYLMGSPLQAGTDIRPWGLRVIESPEVTEGKFMVADTVMGATIYDRQAPVIEMFEQDGNNVTKNLYTIRCECRMAFAVETANAFIGGDLEIGAGSAG